MYISITKTTHPGTLLPSDQLGFGIHYTDHMFIMDYSDEKGWYDPRIVPFQNISLSPAACVFHYGAEVFEGLKAYRRPDGEVQLFRPWDNMERMKNSAIRLGLPVVPPEDALEAVKALVKVDERWVPSDPGTSLYIRPFLYGTDAKLGLHGVHTAQFIIILSPVGSYFDNGMEPVKIIVETEDVRAVRGGTGEAKCGGNYGASNRAGERAFANGYSQVLWLDGVEHKYVEEGGGMNVVFKINGRIITPMLTGSILPGVTRRSCLQLFEDWGMPVEERLISVDELFEAAANGTLEEAMCVGTAAVICPIGELTYGGKVIYHQQLPDRPWPRSCYDTLTGNPVGHGGGSPRLDLQGLSCPGNFSVDLKTPYRFTAVSRRNPGDGCVVDLIQNRLLKTFGRSFRRQSSMLMALTGQPSRAVSASVMLVGRDLPHRGPSCRPPW